MLGLKEPTRNLEGRDLQSNFKNRITCPQGQYKIGSKCLPCASGCSVCSSGVKCSKCASSLLVLKSGVCSCKTGYQMDQNGTCIAITCPAGQFLNGGRCTFCSANCETCTSATSCTKCSTSFTLNAGGCDCSSGVFTSDGLCSASCPAGYFMTSTNTCSNCSIGCTTCSSATLCSQCNTTFTLSNGACSCGSGSSNVNGVCVSVTCSGN